MYAQHTVPITGTGTDLYFWTLTDPEGEEFLTSKVKFLRIERIVFWLVQRDTLHAPIIIDKQEVKVIWQKEPHGGPISLNSWGRVSY